MLSILEKFQLKAIRVFGKAACKIKIFNVRNRYMEYKAGISKHFLQSTDVFYLKGKMTGTSLIGSLYI